LSAEEAFYSPGYTPEPQYSAEQAFNYGAQTSKYSTDRRASSASLYTSPEKYQSKGTLPSLYTSADTKSQIYSDKSDQPVSPYSAGYKPAVQSSDARVSNPYSPDKAKTFSSYADNKYNLSAQYSDTRKFAASGDARTFQPSHASSYSQQSSYGQSGGQGSYYRGNAAFERTEQIQRIGFDQRTSHVPQQRAGFDQAQQRSGFDQARQKTAFFSAKDTGRTRTGSLGEFPRPGFSPSSEQSHNQRYADQSQALNTFGRPAQEGQNRLVTRQIASVNRTFNTAASDERYDTFTKRATGRTLSNSSANDLPIGVFIWGFPTTIRIKDLMEQFSSVGDIKNSFLI
jgi:hypothetical protein